MCSRDQCVQRGTRDAIVHVGPYVWVGPYVRPVLVAPVSLHGVCAACAGACGPAKRKRKGAASCVCAAACRVSEATRTCDGSCGVWPVSAESGNDAFHAPWRAPAAFRKLHSIRLTSSARAPSETSRRADVPSASRSDVNDATLRLVFSLESGYPFVFDYFFFFGHVGCESRLSALETAPRATRFLGSGVVWAAVPVADGSGLRCGSARRSRLSNFLTS